MDRGLAVIDLGYVGDVPGEPPPDDTPRPRSPVPFLSVLAAVLLLGGSVVPVPALTSTVSRYDGMGSSYEVAGDRLYIVRNDSGRRQQPVWVVVAMDLPAGRTLWSAPYASTGERIIRIDTAGPVVLIAGGDSTGGVRRTDAFEAATGRVLWSVTEEVGVVTAAHVGLLVGADPPSIAARDLTTGRELWRAAYPGRFTLAHVPGTGPRHGTSASRERVAGPVGAGGGSVPGGSVPGGSVPGGGSDGDASGRPERLAVLGYDGRLELRDLRTGAVVAAADPLGPSALPISGVGAGDSIVVWYADRQGTGLASLDADTLAVRWRRAQQVDGVGLGRCAGRVCVTGDQAVSALDPDTGATAWQVRDASLVVEVRGHLIAYGPVAGGLGPLHTLDPDTGAAVADLHGWRTGSRGDPVVTRIPMGRAATVIAILTGEHGEVQPLGMSDEVLLSCQSSATAVVCRTGGGTLRIWSLRP